MAPFSPNVIGGDVCTIRLHITWPGPDQIPWNTVATELGNVFAHEAELAIRDVLGSEFALTTVAYGPGSLTILVVVGTAYYAIANYKDFVESLKTLASQLRRLAEGIFGRFRQQGPSIIVSLTPGPGLLRIGTRRTQASGQMMPWLLGYLILSHAVLLGVLIWLLLNRSP